MDGRQCPVRAAGPQKSHMWSIQTVQSLSHTLKSLVSFSVDVQRNTNTAGNPICESNAQSSLRSGIHILTLTHTHTGSEVQLQQNAHTVILKYQGSSVTCRAVRNERGWSASCSGCQLVSFSTQNWFEAPKPTPDLFLSVCFKYGLPYWIRQVIPYLSYY